MLTVIYSECGYACIFRRSGFSQSDLSQEFKTTEDEVKFGCNSQFVSMILLAVAALFFTVLAIMYVSVRSRDAVSFGLEDKGEFSGCTCYSLTHWKSDSRMTNVIFFLAANTFPFCPQDVGWSKSVASEVRESNIVLPLNLHVSKHGF
jgi:hypothetical protein